MRMFLLRMSSAATSAAATDRFDRLSYLMAFSLLSAATTPLFVLFFRNVSALLPVQNKCFRFYRVDLGMLGHMGMLVRLD